MDDDNYLNPEALLALLSRFPQDADVYVGKPSLDKPITAHELMDGNRTVPKQSSASIFRFGRSEKMDVDHLGSDLRPSFSQSR